MKRLLPLWRVFFLLSQGFSMNVMKAPGKINSGHTDVAPVPSPDGKVLYFTSERPGQGGQDLWVGHFAGGIWTEPKALPGPLNSKFNEGADSIAYDRDNIYMYMTRCNRPEGKGMCDLYVSSYNQNGSWSEPKNLGAPVTSEFSESNSFFDSSDNILYFTSNRPGGLAKAMNEKKFCEPIKVATTGPVVMAPPIEDEVGKKKTIYFQFNQSALTARAQADLEPWAEWLKGNPGRKIAISGYTDSLGDKVYNKKLSRKRAQAVKNWLESQGVTPDLISDQVLRDGKSGGAQ